MLKFRVGESLVDRNQPLEYGLVSFRDHLIKHGKFDMLETAVDITQDGLKPFQCARVLSNLYREAA